MIRKFLGSIVLICSIFSRGMKYKRSHVDWRRLCDDSELYMSQHVHSMKMGSSCLGPSVCFYPGRHMFSHQLNDDDDTKNML